MILDSLPEVHIWTDGGQHGRNPGNGSGVAVLTYKNKVMVVGTPIGFCTNNVAETHGAITALKSLKVPCQIVLHTDSNYVLYGIRKVLRGCTLNTNVESWNLFAAELKQRRHKIKDIVHTDGHADDELNNLADAWATYCAQTQMAVVIEYGSVADALVDMPRYPKKARNTKRDKANKARRKYG